MKTMIKIAVKNQLRNKRRTALTELTIIFSVIVVLFVTAFMQSLSASWKSNIIDADLGHIQVMSRGYRKELISPPLDQAIADVDRVVQELKRTEGVLSATKRISINGLVSSAGETAPFFGRGIDVASVESVLPKIYTAIVKGKPLSADTPGGALVGKGLAELVGAGLGDRLLLAAYDKYKALNAIEVFVQGIYNIPEETVNNSLLITDFKTMQSLSGLEGASTEILLRASDESAVDVLIPSLKRQYKSLAVKPWTDLAGSFTKASSMFSVATAVVSVILYVVVLMMLASTVLTNVFERKREIGTLMALGSSKGQVIASFIIESLCLAYIGIVVGTLVHALLMVILQNGLTIPPLPGGTENIVLDLSFDLNQVATITLMISTIATLAALYPAFLASKVNPIEAIGSRG